MEGLPATCNVPNSADGSNVGSPEQELFPLPPLPPLADLSPLSPFDPETFMQEHEPQIQDLLTSLESSTPTPERHNDLTSSAGIDPRILQGHSAVSNRPDSLTLPSFCDDYNTLPLPPLPLHTRTSLPILSQSNFQLLPLFPGPPTPVPPKSKHRPSGPFFVLPPPVVPKDNHGGRFSSLRQLRLFHQRTMRFRYLAWLMHFHQLLQKAATTGRYLTSPTHLHQSRQRTTTAHYLALLMCLRRFHQSPTLTRCLWPPCLYSPVDLLSHVKTTGSQPKVATSVLTSSVPH
jgi:hypothetical protein